MCLSSVQDSVVDGSLSDRIISDPEDVPQRAQMVSQTCSDGQKPRRPVRRLDETLTRLQNLQHRRVQQTTCLQTFQVMTKHSLHETVYG